jgi:hypothetical protein
MRTESGVGLLRVGRDAGVHLGGRRALDPAAFRASLIELLARLFYHGLPDRLDKPDLASAAR